MILYIALLIILAVCLFLTIQYSLFLPPVNGLPILMYHKVSKDINDGLTITSDKLESHFKYFTKKNYTCLPLKKVLESKDASIPKRSFVLTFDDAYLNNLQLLYPLLQKYGFHATIMLPVGYLGKTNVWDKGSEPLMDYRQLQSMDSTFVSFGLHSHKHISMKSSSFEEISKDISSCFQDLKQKQIEFLPVLAYPYGAYPKDRKTFDAFAELLSKLGVTHGLRIGNRINKWPLKTRYEIRRIDIRGDDSLWTFKTKLKKGRVKMF